MACESEFMTTKIFPVRIGKARFEEAEQVPTNPAWVSALHAEHLKGTSFCLCTPGAHTPLVIRRYGADSGTPHYGLARQQDTGTRHHQDCRFFDDEADAGKGANALPAFEQLDDGSIRAHLAFSLQLAQPVQPLDGAAPSKGKAGSTRARASEVSMLYRLWRTGRLNIYQGQPRKWFQVAFRLLTVAKQIVINSQNEKLADYLLIAAAEGDKAIVAHNQAVLTRVKSKRSRLLVIGCMRDPKVEGQGVMFLPVKDYKVLPKIRIVKDTVSRLLQRRPIVRNLVVTKQVSGQVVMLASIEPDKGDFWQVHRIAVMPTSQNFIPAESSYEIEFEDYLVGESRTFMKPIALNELDENDQRPDYILLDTLPRIRCEVWGMKTEDYLNGKAARIAEYARKGQELVSWSANPREPFPPLKPANTK